MKTLCASCGISQRRPHHAYCLTCHAAYQRQWRAKHQRSSAEKLKDACRSYAYVYLKRGKLTRQPCVNCSSEVAQMHHPDYEKPLNIVWLCRPCHLALHRA